MIFNIAHVSALTQLKTPAWPNPVGPKPYFLHACLEVSSSQKQEPLIARLSPHACNGFSYMTVNPCGLPTDENRVVSWPNGDLVSVETEHKKVLNSNYGRRRL
jgi:hypothetical protein